MRHYLGEGKYRAGTIALADDSDDANGHEALDFWQAQESARDMRGSKKRSGAPYSVSQAIADYLAEHLEGKPSYYEIKTRLEAYAIPAFGDTLVTDLTAEKIRRWHNVIAKQGARIRRECPAAC